MKTREYELTASGDWLKLTKDLNCLGGKRHNVGNTCLSGDVTPLTSCKIDICPLGCPQLAWPREDQGRKL
ncbi:hypothetical protein XPR_0064 [Xanthomonas arboricola pv. pruni MAFF 301420]|uniref:Uncharacterized protein n=2 Tax=Xanthomonas arboricola pv. pruni TaxID=69929 RepID=W4SC00_9XANT|nr:hypothetical protein XPU_1061 [Xanthomonas arboricola pv. pruni str. MAFF 311562]GAE53429.1 hypothetical protein XPR_0064 [Xanthomonas arboricola pv. pruni MAFF 301420]GAE61423.1 hypothetical protein XPN_3329 [Xanthomonas arboricola pv. pruni MAFF 301427]